MCSKVCEKIILFSDLLKLCNLIECVKKLYYMSKICIIKFSSLKNIYYKILFLKQRKKKKKKKKRMRYFILFSYLAFKLKKIPGPHMVTTFTYKSEPTLNQFTNSSTFLLSHDQEVHMVLWDRCLNVWVHEISVSYVRRMRYFLWLYIFFPRNTKILIP